MSDTLEMKVLHPNTHVATEQTGRVVLPGAPDGDTGMSPAQFVIVQRYAMERFPNLKTWGEARDPLRRQLRMHPNQYDFGMVEEIFRNARKALVNNGLSERQANRLGWYLSILFGTETHPSIAVQARLDGMRVANPRLIERLQLEAVSVTTQGQYTTFRMKVVALLRVPDDFEDSDVEPTPVTNGEEPF